MSTERIINGGGVAIVLDQLRIILYKGLVKRIDLDRVFEKAI
mgnify:CR=1 FL=1